MKIIVDADACPKTVLNITMNLGTKYGVPVWTVASFNHNIESHHHIMVGNESQEADMKIVNVCETGDIVVTQDWGLAALVLGKRAHCIHPAGWIFHTERIDFMLEEREIKAKLRRAGGRTKGPKKRSSEDDVHFQETLEKLLRQ